jgi:hypothetical protein
MTHPSLGVDGKPVADLAATRNAVRETSALSFILPGIRRRREDQAAKA